MYCTYTGRVVLLLGLLLKLVQNHPLRGGCGGMLIDDMIYDDTLPLYKVLLL